MSNKELEELLLSQTFTSLNDNEIYEMESYGWSSEDTEDEEYLGHAIVQIEPLLGSSITPSPIEISELELWQKDCAIAQADFSGVMTMARLSIGLAIFHGEEWKNNFFSEGDLFNLHWMGSVVNLGIASDRIRDFFVTSLFEKTVKEYEVGKFNDKIRNWYQTPFLEAAPHLQSLSSERPFSPEKVIEMSEEVHKFRDRRNLIVHEIATHRGTFEKKRVSGELPQIIVDFDFDQLQESQKRTMAEHQNKISQALADLKSSYELLIRFSNDIFVGGHEWQRHRQSQG